MFNIKVLGGIILALYANTLIMICLFHTLFFNLLKNKTGFLDFDVCFSLGGVIQGL